LEFNVPFQHKYGYIRDDLVIRKGRVRWFAYAECKDDTQYSKHIQVETLARGDGYALKRILKFLVWHETILGFRSQNK